MCHFLSIAGAYCRSQDNGPPMDTMSIGLGIGRTNLIWKERLPLTEGRECVNVFMATLPYSHMAATTQWQCVHSGWNVLRAMSWNTKCPSPACRYWIRMCALSSATIQREMGFRWETTALPTNMVVSLVEGVEAHGSSNISGLREWSVLFFCVPWKGIFKLVSLLLMSKYSVETLGDK